MQNMSGEAKASNLSRPQSSLPSFEGPSPNLASKTKVVQENVIVEYVELEDFLMDQQGAEIVDQAMVPVQTEGSQPSEVMNLSSPRNLTECSSSFTTQYNNQPSSNRPFSPSMGSSSSGSGSTTGIVSNTPGALQTLLTAKETAGPSLSTTNIPVQIVRPQLSGSVEEENNSPQPSKRRHHASAPQTLQTAFEPQEVVARKNHRLLSQFKEELEEDLRSQAVTTPSSGENSDSHGQEFREMLEKMATRSESGTGEGTSPNKSKKRRARNSIPSENKDEKYWRRRLKNNVAARRSREAKRAKESQMVVRADFLEKEHDVLRSEIERARAENNSLKTRLAKYEQIENP